MNSGKYRHRITVQSYQDVVDPSTGYREPQWVDLFVDIPAEYKAGPGREYLAAESLRSEVQGRFIFRWFREAVDIPVDAQVLWDGRVFEVKAPPLSDDTGRTELTLMVAEKR